MYSIIEKLPAVQLTFPQVAHHLTRNLGRRITHVNITEDELAAGMSAFMPKEYASMLAQLDTAIKNGVEDKLNNVVEKVTGKKPRRFEDYLNECLQNGVWMMK
jgi:festuclavine dehydrogenase